MEMHVAASSDPTAADLPPRPLRHHLALSVYWLSNTVLWGALLHLGMQSRLSDWKGEAHVGYYLGIVGFIGGLVGTASQIVIGAFSDRSLNRWGRRRPYLLSFSLLSAGALVLMGAAKSYWPFFGAFILVELFTNAAAGPFSALLPDTVNPREHGKAAGFMGVARLVGDMGGVILAGQLLNAGTLVGPAATAFHDQRFFLLSAFTAGLVVLTMLITCVTIRERPLERRPDATLMETALQAFQVDVRGNPGFFWLSLSRAITNFGFYMFLEVMYFFVRYTMQVPRPERAAMLILLPAIFCAALSSVPSGVLSDRVGRRRLIFVAQFVMAGGGLMFFLAPNMTVAYVAGIPAGLAYGIFVAVEWALACNLLPPGESGRYLGVWNASSVLPQVLAIPLSGVIGSTISARVPGLGWRVDFAIAMVCCLLGAYFLRHVQERRTVSAAAEADEPAE